MFWYQAIQIEKYFLGFNVTLIDIRYKWLLFNNQTNVHI